MVRAFARDHRANGEEGRGWSGTTRRRGAKPA